MCFKIVASGAQSRHFLQRLPELRVVMLYAVVQVDFDLLEGQGVEDVFFVRCQLSKNFFQFADFLQGRGLVPARRARAHAHFLQVPLARAELVLEGAQVVVEDHRHGIWPVAVHVDERVEAAFGARKQPVDGPLLVHFHVMCVKLAREVLADVFPQGVLDKRQVLGEVLVTKRYTQKLLEPVHNVVFKPRVV